MSTIDYTRKRPVAMMDTECYVNYWSIGFKDIEGRRYGHFSMFEDGPMDRSRIAKALRYYRVAGFNSIKYDLPMIAYAMQEGVTNAQLKQLSDELIRGLSPWDAEDKYDLHLPDFIDHIDLFNVHPGAAQKPSLKNMGGRLHSRKIQDLPFDPMSLLDPEQVELLDLYHVNDLDTTHDLYTEMLPQIELRAQLSNQYGVDLRSKSDAQIAEAVIRAEVERITGQRLWKPDLKAHEFFYDIPGYIKFETPALQELLEEIRTTPFQVDPFGVDINGDTDKKKGRLVSMPDFLRGRDITIEETVYRMGLGGLHSQEESRTIYASDEVEIHDDDVTSYYPRTIIKAGLAPAHIGKPFLQVYETIYERRVAAKKKSKDKALAKEEQRHWKDVQECLKIVLNGSFGKFGSKYSVICSPKLMIQVTLSGQLSILMLIEWLEKHGIHVVSANTDGIVTLVPKDKLWIKNAVIWDWELATGYETERTQYVAVHSRDVNCYLAITTDGEVKTKGPIGPCGPGLPAAMGMKKTPTGAISATAVREYLTKKTPIEETINKCQDVRQFVHVRRVTGGCRSEHDGGYIGKVVRYYYSTERKGFCFRYNTTDNSVPRTDGAHPLMELPEFDECPSDLDRAWYIREAYAILQDVGMGKFDPDLAGRSGTILARLPRAKNFHYVDSSTGETACGVTTRSIREPWVEAKYLPVGHRLCPKCRKASDY